MLGPLVVVVRSLLSSRREEHEMGSDRSGRQHEVECVLLRSSVTTGQMVEECPDGPSMAVRLLVDQIAYLRIKIGRLPE